MSYRRMSVMAVLALAPVVFVAACSDNNGGSGGSPFSPSQGGSLKIEDFVSSASVGTSDGTVQRGFPPTGSGGPTVSVTGNSIVVNGGASEFDVSAASPFSRIFVSLAGESHGLSTSASTGLGDYYAIDLPTPQTDATLLLTFPPSLPTAEFDVFFSVGDEAGGTGPISRLNFDVLQVGTGDVQVTLAWDSDSDVDLHVVDPSGQEVFWANRDVPSGGNLDLDSNAGCSLDDVRNENIVWPVGQAPQGTYTVRVDYWSSCGVEATDYTVLVNNGGNVEVFSGQFTGTGDRGGAGSGIDITTFERTTGPIPARLSAPPPPSGPTTKR